VSGAVANTECNSSDPFPFNEPDFSERKLSKVLVDFFVAGDQFVNRELPNCLELVLSRGVGESRLIRSELWSHV
jgi:hypothetical protein